MYYHYHNPFSRIVGYSRFNKAIGRRKVVLSVLFRLPYEISELMTSSESLNNETGACKPSLNYLSFSLSTLPLSFSSLSHSLVFCISPLSSTLRVSS